MPPVEFFEEDDDWRSAHWAARHVRPPLRPRMDDFARRSDLLIPEERGHGGGLHRTRSQGHTPAPNVTVYNTTHMDQDANPRVEQRGSPGAAARASPRGRMPGEWALEDEIEALRHELARERQSSASRPAHRDHSTDYERWQLEATKARLKEAEDRLEQEQHDELIRRRLELKYMKERQERGDEDARVKADGKRLRDEWDLRQEREERRREQRMREQDEERRRIIAENTTKLEREDRERAEARQRAVDEFNRKKADQDRKAKEERDKAIADYERKKVEDAAKTKREREALVLQLKLEEDARKKKEKDEYEHFLRIQKQKEEDEKAKKKKHEAELEEQMRKRLAQFGFQENQIVAMIKPEKAKELHQGQTPLNPLPMTPYQHYQPTYPKIHRDHVAVDTLVYYDIPYEYDRADPNYLIIMREMDQRETEILFEHTRRLRTRGGARLLIEERHDNRGRSEYAFVRRRRPSPSPAQRRSSPKRNVGLREMFL